MSGQITPATWPCAVSPACIFGNVWRRYASRRLHGLHKFRGWLPCRDSPFRWRRTSSIRLVRYAGRLFPNTWSPPANPAPRDRICRNVFCYNGFCRNDSVVSDSHALQDSCIGADPNVLTQHVGSLVSGFPLFGRKSMIWWCKVTYCSDNRRNP